MSDFDDILSLFESTHRALQHRASRAVDSSLVARNWLFGWYLVESEGAAAERSELYGKQLIDRISAHLKELAIKGTSPTNLRKFREFYLAYPKIRQTLSVGSGADAFPKLDADDKSEGLTALTQIQQTLSVESSMPADSTLDGLASQFSLSWSHYVALLAIVAPEERSFYEIEARDNQWSLRELKRQLNSGLYERLSLSRDQQAIRQLSEKGQTVESPADLIKSPYILEFLGLDEKSTYSESDLETAIIDKLEHFLLELGKGFLFEARQKRFTFDEDHYFVDLVFYNRLLRCYTLIDLKIGEITHQDLGQMQMYVNYFDRHVKTPDEAPTIGIVLCRRKKDALVEITLPRDSNIHASEYQLYLPTKAQLKAQLESVEMPLPTSVDGEEHGE